jgi:hypothetical protein
MHSLMHTTDPPKKALHRPAIPVRLRPHPSVSIGRFFADGCRDNNAASIHGNIATWLDPICQVAKGSI